ncbi:unnamed protein product [Didymodactylos carnosus]|nr:unnamed protein product [Didymodactylos carnosus]CAF4661510.1 unnamed protein product [Didymodactylos carnosus]
MFTPTVNQTDTLCVPRVQIQGQQYPPRMHEQTVQSEVLSAKRLLTCSPLREEYKTSTRSSGYCSSELDSTHLSPPKDN